jgi:hypothetical protein
MSRAITPKDIHDTSTVGRAFAASLVTSQAAGLIMAVVMMLVFAIFLGHGPLYPVQVIGSIVFGEAALDGLQWSAVLAGLVAHMLVALAWGVVFGVVATRVDLSAAPKAAIAGVIVAIVSMIDVYLIVPPVMTGLHGADIWNREVPIGWDWAAHMVYGLSYGLYPMIERRLYGRE